MTDAMYSLESEQGVLGSVFNDYRVLDKIVAEMDAEDFYVESHQTIFCAMQDAKALSPTGELDAVMVRDALSRMGKLETVGGINYLVDIHERACGTGVLPYDIMVVKNFRARRRAVMVGRQLLGATVQDNIEDVISEARKSLENMPATQNRESEELHAAVPDAVDAMLEGRPGLQTGMSRLDWTLCGMQPGQLLVVGARPSVGKTAFALSIILHLIKQGIAVTLVSLEMSKQEITQRLMCMESKVNLQKARHGRTLCGLSEEVLGRLVESGNRMMAEKWPLYIIEGGGITSDSLGLVVSRERSQRKIGLLVVDYLQLLPASRATATHNRTAQITDLSRCMKVVAMTEQIPVLALSQLNRAAESREGKRPRMTDLRESGSIEQDADVVMLLHREDCYHRGEMDYRPDHIMTALVAKHRNGPTGCVKLNFHEEYILVTDQATN